MFNKIFYMAFCLSIILFFFPCCSNSSTLQPNLNVRITNHTEIREVGIKYLYSPSLTIGLGWSNVGVSNYDYSLIRYNKVSLLTINIGF